MRDMFIYLVQHAEAKPETLDPERGLTEKGIRDMHKVGAFLKGKIPPCRVYHSSKKRAIETANIVTEYIDAIGRHEETTGLNPLDPPQEWFERIKKTNEDIMLIGHLPHLSLLASVLLNATKEITIIGFKYGSLVCIKRVESHPIAHAVEWMIMPEII